MILVTGATGRLGSQVVRLLRAARLELRCLVRPGSQYYWLNDTGANYFFGDLRNPTLLRRSLRGCTHVIHTANIRVETTANNHGATIGDGGISLVAAANEAGIRHFVMTSCLGVERGYTNAAFAALARVESALSSSGLSHTIVRCGPFVDDFSEVARRISRGEQPKVFGDPENQVCPIYRKDAALFAIASLDHPAGHDRAIDVVGPEALSVDDALKRACKLANVEPSYRLFHGAAAKLAIRAGGLAGRRWRHAFEREQILLSSDGVRDMEALSRAFGLKLTAFDEAVKAELAEERPWEDPDGRNTKVVHRQFQATVYEPGQIPLQDLPEGPQKFDAE